MSEATKRVRLSRLELAQLKWLTGELLALFSLWTVFYLEVSGKWIFAMFVAAILLCLAQPALLGKIPRFVWKALTPLLITVIALDFIFAQPDFISPLVRMVVLLAMVRALAYRTRREDMQLVLLCLFVVIISGVLTLSLTFALQMLLFAPVAMIMLFLINLSECCAKENETANGIWDGFHWRGLLARWRRVVDFWLLGFVALMFAGVVAVSTIIFIIIPRFRFEQALPFLQLKSQRTLSGFSDRIKFGDVVDIVADDSVALRVDLSPGVTAPVRPYWRMVALDEYNGDGFEVSASARSSNHYFSDSHFPNPQGPDGQLWPGNHDRWTFYLEGGVSKYLPTVGLFKMARFQNRLDLEFNYSLRLLATREAGSTVLFYQFENGGPADNLAATNEDRYLTRFTPVAVEPKDLKNRLKFRYPITTLIIPGGEKNLSVLRGAVGEITGGANMGARDFCERAGAWLARHHNYSTQAVIPPGGEDTLVRWMKSGQPGHCELFAGALVLLARTAGFPTRVATGFMGGTWNGFENYYMVRNSDAHAWCEVFDGQDAWFRVDPTASLAEGGVFQSQNRVGGVRLIIEKTFIAYLDSLRVIWYRRIVNFDQEQQGEMASTIRNWGFDSARRIKIRVLAMLADFKNLSASPWSGGKVIKLLGFLVGVGGFSVFCWLVWREYRILRGSNAEWVLHPVRRRAGRLVIRFREIRERRKANSPTTGASPSSVGDEWDGVYRDLLNLRFGRGHDWPKPKAVFRRARRLLKTRR